MRLKDNSIHPNTLGLTVALIVANEVLLEHGVDMLLTSMNDGLHSDNSLHYYDNGFDVRTRDPQSKEFLYDVAVVVKEIRSRLNRHYDVINEIDHIHVEFDPKRGPGK